jgi:hypothetical protein
VSAQWESAHPVRAAQLCKKRWFFSFISTFKNFF